MFVLVVVCTPSWYSTERTFSGFCSLVAFLCIAYSVTDFLEWKVLGF